MITDGNTEHRQLNHKVACLYGYLHSGDASVSLADLETLQAKEACSVPLTYWELEKMLGAFGNLMGVVLVLAHLLSIAYKDLRCILQSGLRDDLHATLEHRGHVKPPQPPQPPTPDLISMLNPIIMQIYVSPHLPPVLYKMAYPKKPQALPSDGSIPGLVSLGVSSGSSSGISGASGAASTVFGLTTPTAQPPPTGQGAFQANLQPVPTITSMDRPSLKIKDIIGTSPPPKMTDGSEV